VQARPVQISASGFCTINNSLVGSVSEAKLTASVCENFSFFQLFGAIATYLIVLLQFAPYILEITNSTLSSVPQTIMGQNGHVYRLVN